MRLFFLNIFRIFFKISCSKTLQTCHIFKHVTQHNLLLLEGFWLGPVLLTIEVGARGGGGGLRGVSVSEEIQ